ncbi:methionyl-tRNA formyltransferase [Gilvimarinus sp. DA14]|uniref:methionyl-tRNA formyltransferase n=1 Tax=Gilvimarinus sp. DA14 TaxID=2956798 RepID=UPI0020B8B9C0|nr:methionyl-tRNA formyltransferase [Gilvimarinus sp. DA14]UTF59096.1 methionyl-tRNA formyltransferase [Gilvimarinus sp. DA14]
MTAPLRIVFAGTPDFAAHHLQVLLDGPHQVIACYTQPDRPAGRGKKLKPSPVKSLAEQAGIAVYQPHSLKDPVAQSELAALDADIMVVVAYGLLLPKAVLETPRLGCINVHASLLPRWRGAAPIQRAIEAGDRESGITIMQMDEGLDTGDMLVTASCPITVSDTGGSLHDKLLSLGGPALEKALAQLATDSALPQTQEDSLSNYAPKISKAEAQINWSDSAENIDRKIRAFNPFPVAFTRHSAKPEAAIRLWQCELAPAASGSPGTIIELDADRITVACGTGGIAITQLQMPGKKPMAVADLLRGNSDLFKIGDRFTGPEA